MTTLTVNIESETEQALLEETLTKLGFHYSVDTNADYAFSKDEIASLVKTKQDYLDGKTTARNWEDIEEDLKERYGDEQ